MNNDRPFPSKFVRGLQHLPTHQPTLSYLSWLLLMIPRIPQDCSQFHHDDCSPSLVGFVRHLSERLLALKTLNCSTSTVGLALSVPTPPIVPSAASSPGVRNLRHPAPPRPKRDCRAPSQLGIWNRRQHPAQTRQTRCCAGPRPAAAAVRATAAAAVDRWYR